MRKSVKIILCVETAIFMAISLFMGLYTTGALAGGEAEFYQAEFWQQELWQEETQNGETDQLGVSEFVTNETPDLCACVWIAPEENGPVAREISEAADTEECDPEACVAQEAIIIPEIVLSVEIDGERLLKGTNVTIHAHVQGIPEGTGYSLQWQNNLGMDGNFADVPGETGHSVSFLANEENVNCVWRVTVTLQG